jgi:hypothetical protein
MPVRADGPAAAHRPRRCHGTRRRALDVRDLDIAAFSDLAVHSAKASVRAEVAPAGSEF